MRTRAKLAYMRLDRFKPAPLQLDPPTARTWLVAVALAALATSCLAWGLYLWVR